jgi:hypothetical protein
MPNSTALAVLQACLATTHVGGGCMGLGLDLGRCMGQQQQQQQRVSGGRRRRQRAAF